MRARLYGSASLCLMLVLAHTASGSPRNWKPATTGYWTNADNWVETVVPGAGDDVFITSGGNAFLSEPSSNLNSITIANTLTFKNWNSILTATTVIITNGGTVTLPGAFTDTDPSNNIYIACSNLTLAADSSIFAEGKGYLGQANAAGYGPGGGVGNGSGSYGGHAGYGGATYGSFDAPTAPGSAGGSSSVWGPGNGGGAVRIQASGTVAINGTLTANGGSGSYCGGGSGGGIYVTCVSLTGSGIVCANGGTPYSSYPGAGGGRIAVIYDTNAQAQIAVPSILFQAAGGVGEMYYGGVGSLYFPDNRFLNETFQHVGEWNVPGFQSWAPTNLLIRNNAWLKLPADGFRLAVSNRLEVSGTVGDAYRLELNNGIVTCGGDALLDRAAMGLYGNDSTGHSFNCGGNLILTNAAMLTVGSGPTNSGTAVNWGALVNVANDVLIATNAVMYLSSHPTNGGSALVRMRNLTIAGGGSINADARGYMGTMGAGYGPGAGSGAWVGGGYGGKGGNASGNYGQTYGSSNAPIDAGSAGGGQNNYTGGYGGGLVRIQATGTVAINGTLTANGGGKYNYTAAGSGGGIYVTCGTFTGNGGVIRANGGVTETGYPDGGGGRIAVWRMTDSFVGTIEAAGGVGGTVPPETGTVVRVLVVPDPVGVMIQAR